MKNEGLDEQLLSPSLINKKERMKQLLVEQFKGKSVLYNIIEERDELSYIFTDTILSMDPKITYSTHEVADLCETPGYNINNKRKEFIDYINPQIIGGPNARNWKHDYLAVFKLKMIDYLTGQDGIYTLKQLKQLLYGHVEHEGETPPYDTMYQMMNQLGQAFKGLTPGEIQRAFKVMSTDEFQNVISTDPSKNPILNQSYRITELESRLAALPGETKMESKFKNIEEQIANSKAEQKEVIEACLNITNQIKSVDLPIKEKEKLLNTYDELEVRYQNQIDLIQIYREASNDRVRMLAQEKREQEVLKIKETAFSLYEKTLNEGLSSYEREHALGEIESIKENNPDIRADIMIFIIQAKKLKRLEEQRQKQEVITENQDKVGFISHLLSYWKK
jgi:hypothetical protein